MDNALPYYENLHIDAGTKKLMVNMLRSIRSVVPAADPPGPALPDEDLDSGHPTGMDEVWDRDYIHRVMILAKVHSEELEGIFDPDELLRYSRYISDYQDVISQMENTLEDLRRCRDNALKYAGRMAEMVEDHLHMAVIPQENQVEKTQWKGLRLNGEMIKLKVV